MIPTTLRAACHRLAIWSGSAWDRMSTLIEAMAEHGADDSNAYVRQALTALEQRVSALEASAKLAPGIGTEGGRNRPRL